MDQIIVIYKSVVSVDNFYFKPLGENDSIFDKVSLLDWTGHITCNFHLLFQLAYKFAMVTKRYHNTKKNISMIQSKYIFT